MKWFLMKIKSAHDRWTGPNGKVNLVVSVQYSDWKIETQVMEL